MSVIKIKCTECGKMIPKTVLAVEAEIKRHWGTSSKQSVAKSSVLAQERIEALLAKLTPVSA